MKNINLVKINLKDIDLDDVWNVLAQKASDIDLKPNDMNIEQSLTKENFWNEIEGKYPNACKLFCDWIDRYKRDVSWEMLFNMGIANYNFGHRVYYRYGQHDPKFHDLPYAMQQGIWIEFAVQTLNEYFEQPEYVYSGDLAEDIEKVFSELERI